MWRSIGDLHRTGCTHSTTGAMRDAFIAKAGELQDILESIRPLLGQNGLMVFVDGVPVGLDIVADEATYAKLHSQLVRSYAIDALTRGHPQKPTFVPDQGKALCFLANAKSATEEQYDSIGYGKDLRYRAQGLLGSALVWQDVVIHTALFATRD